MPQFRVILVLLARLAFWNIFISGLAWTPVPNGGFVIVPSVPSSQIVSSECTLADTQPSFAFWPRCFR